MQMRVMQHGLPPGVKDGDEADLGAQVLGIGSDRAQGLGSGVKQDFVDHGLVLVGDRGDFLGQREDYVEIVSGNELGLAILQPLRAHQGLTLRAVAISATVERDARVAAFVTLLDVTTERDGATTLDRAHDAALPTAEGISVLLAVGRAGLAEDVRHLEPGGAQRSPQRGAGGVGVGGGDSTLGNKSKGLIVAHTVVVATFK